MVVTGADLSPTVNGRPAPMWTAFEVREGDVLAFGAPRAGQWGYLALPGGVDVPVALGSRATYTRAALGGYGGRRLQRADRIAALRRAPAVRLALAAPLWPRVGGACELRVVLGPQDGYFAEDATAVLAREAYRIGFANRIAPAVGVSCKRISLEVVVLPQPLVPSNTSVSPSFTSKEILFTASEAPKRLLIFSATIICNGLPDRK